MKNKFNNLLFFVSYLLFFDQTDPIAISASIEDNNWSNFTVQQLFKKLFNISVIFIIVASKTVIKSRTFVVKLESQVAPVNDNFCVFQPSSDEKVITEAQVS